MKLYELSEKYQQLQNAIEEGEIPEEAIKDTLSGLTGEFKIKADNIACMIKNLESEAEVIEEEAKRQIKRANAKKKKAERMREYLKNQLIFCDIGKMETARNKIQIKNNPPKLEIEDKFMEWAALHTGHFLKYKEPEPDRTAIKEALQNGSVVPYVKLISEQRVDIR